MPKDFFIFVGHQNEDYLEKVKTILDKYYTVNVSAKGCDIVNAVLDLQPDLAILDYDISEIDVLKLCEKIDGGYAHINTIIYVVLDKLDIAKKKWKKRAIDYIVGPLEVQEFAEDVHKGVRNILLERERQKLIRNKIELRYHINNSIIKQKQLIEQALRNEDWKSIEDVHQEIINLEKTIKDIDLI